MKSKTNIKAIIFDLDGTLYNKKKLKLYFIFYFYRNLKILSSYLKIRKNIEGIDFGSQEAFNKEIINRLSIKTSKSKDFCKSFLADFMKKFVYILSKHYKPEDQLILAINKYHKEEIKLVCLSDYSMVSERLKALKIDTDKFALIKSSEEYGALKPSTKSFLNISELLNISTTNILVIGDREDTDGKGAQESKMNFIKYPEDYHLINEYI